MQLLDTFGGGNGDHTAASTENTRLKQHLRSIIVHSIDNFNFRNGEFASERLLAMDSDNLDSLYLYCLCLFHQGKYKSCYHRLVNVLAVDHLGCSYLFGRCCLQLKKFKEGLFQLNKVKYLFNEVCGESVQYFTTYSLFHCYEYKRSIIPDSSVLYHLLGDLFHGIKDTKNSALNYTQALRFNPYDFEAFQKLCRLGVSVNTKAIYGANQNLRFDDGLTETPGYSNTPMFQSSNSNTSFYDEIVNPFAGSNTETPVIHPDDSFNNSSICTPRTKPVTVPDAPLRKSTHSNLSNNFEFTKPAFPIEVKPKNTYSRITSRLISQPMKTNMSTGPNQSGLGVKSKSEGPPKRNTLKRNSSVIMEPSATSNNWVKEVEQCDKTLFKLYLTFAKSYKCISKYDCYKAIRLLESLPLWEKNTPWVLSKLGKLHYEIVNYKQSEYFFTKLRKLDRTRLEDMEYFSTLLWHLHRKVELTYLANELYDLDSESPITWCVIGNLFSLTREPDEAIKSFNRAIKLDDQFTYAYTLKGHEYFGSDNYEMALENFRISLLIDSRHYNALYGIGMVYVNLGDYQKADFHFRKAVSINPINIILICCVGMVLEKLGKKNLALRQYELASKLQPLNPLPMFKKAQLLFSMEQFPQALKWFEVLRDLAPDEASVHYLLGQLYNIQNDKFQAIREFTIALILDPKGNYLIREAMESLKEK